MLLIKNTDELTQWMAAAQNGDRQAYHLLLGRIQSILTGFFKNKVKDRQLVDDLLQTTLLRIHTYRHTFDSQHEFLPWMYTIARNTMNDHFSDRRLKSEVYGHESDEGQANELAENVALNEALLTLTPEQVETIELTKLLGLSMEQAADQQGITVAAMKVRAHRAYQALKQALSE